MAFHVSDARSYQILCARQVGVSFLAAEDLSAVEVPIVLLLKHYTWPANRYVVELSAGVDSIGVQHEITKREAMRAFREVRKRKELWADHLRPELSRPR